MTFELTPHFYQRILSSSNQEAWKTIHNFLVDVWRSPVTSSSPHKEISIRDNIVHELDLFLSSAAWDLWEQYPRMTQSTSQRLEEWWKSNSNGKAILILDGLSLRELPWLLLGAEENGFELDLSLSGAEIPSDTTTFAQSLGFDQRSKLQNNKAHSPKFPDANVESDKLPWNDCLSLVPNTPNVIFWHEWPDEEMHRNDGAGAVMQRLVQSTASTLRSKDFWNFVDRISTGRKLIITSDHGYAVTSNFSTQHAQDSWLQQNFGKQRFAHSLDTPPPFLLPLVLKLEPNGRKPVFSINGRWKWKVQGGFPVLSHGGLTLLEMAVPFLEVQKKQK
jgi:hypothetical protein